MLQEKSTAGTVERGNLTYFPVVPGRIEFARGVRRYLLENRPRVVAVELPSSLEPEYQKALQRMPQMSVIFIPSESEDDDLSGTYLPVEPADPFIEALRTADEMGAQTVLLEPPTPDALRLTDLYPEPYAVELIGMTKYVEAYRVHPQRRTPEIDTHAAAIAWKLQGTDPLASICVVLSLKMLDPVLDAMETPQDEPFARRTSLFRRSQLFNLHPDCLGEVTSEAPYYQELYEASRQDHDFPPLNRHH